MSNPTNDRIEELVYEKGYDAGYEDCRSEMEMKIKAVLKAYLYSDGRKSAFDTATQIGKILEGSGVSVG